MIEENERKLLCLQLQQQRDESTELSVKSKTEIDSGNKFKKNCQERIKKKLKGGII